MTPERKLWHELKKNTPGITWNRIENTAGIGLPDCLGYNTNRHFFTVELKVTKANKINFSPHQIAFHVSHPKNSLILVKSLALTTVKLYEGASCLQLAASGLTLDALREGLDACCSYLDQELAA